MNPLFVRKGRAKPIRVLYVTYGDLLGNVYESQLAPLWRGLVRRGIDVRVFSFLAPGHFLNRAFRRKARRRAREGPAPVTVSFLGAGWPPRLPQLLERRLRRAISSAAPDALHARGAVAAGLCAASLDSISPKDRPKFIYDVRGDALAEIELGELGIPHDRVAAAMRQLRSLEQRACQAADELLCVSSALADLVQRRTGFRGRVRVIPCWGEPPDLHPEPTAEQRLADRTQLAVGPRDWLWCYAGSTARWQALPETISLATRLHRSDRSHRLLLLTDDPQGVQKLCRNLSADPGACITRSGSRSDVVRWLRAGDAAILLRERNAVNRVASPMKLADYLLAGLPILASDGIGDASLSVKEAGVGELVPSLDPEALFEAARRLHRRCLSHGDRLRSRARALYGESLALDRFLPEYSGAYERVSP